MPDPLNMPPCFAHRSPIGDLLDMIERCAPMMMRVGGCAAGINTPNAGSRVTPEMKRRFEDGVRAGRNIKEIAAETGVHFQTVIRHTRHVREELRTHGRVARGAA